MADSVVVPLSKEQLKENVRAIILLQGNAYIKELLRLHGVKIGATKKDFAQNIADAIDDGRLNQAKIEAWLDEVEGWGNQHLYLFAAPSAAPHDVANLLAQSDFKDFVGKKQDYDFPEQFTLSNISHEPDRLSIVWHLGKEGWDRAKYKDYAKTVGLERYRFEAYRQRMDRSILRFEWRFVDAHCAILVHRNKDIDHSEAMAIVWQALQALEICDAPCARLSLSEAVKAASKKKGTKNTRLEADGGFVELVSTLKDGGIDEVEAVRHARNAVNDAEFARAQGMFDIETGGEAGETIAVQVFGSEGRLRLWAQCKRDVVYAVVDHVMKHNDPAADD
jgi:hypothetical protein